MARQSVTVPLAQPLPAHLQNALARVLDMIIPPAAERGMPGASAFEIWPHLCAHEGDGPVQVKAELERLDEEARATGAAGFAALEAGVAQALVDERRARQPGFLAPLARAACAVYYQQDVVREAIGMRPGPAFPQGYEVASGDFSLLEPVKRRGKVYREV